MKLAKLASGLMALALVHCSSSPTIKPSTGGTAPLGASPAGKQRADVLTKDAAALRAKQIGSVSYTLWFGLDATHTDYQGRAVINFNLKSKEASSELLVDFTDGSLRTLTINGASVDNVSEYYDGLRIRVPTSRLSSGQNRIELSYSHPYSTTGSGLHRFQDPVDNRVYLYTDFEPFDAHRAFPCFDQPDLKASYEVTVETPEDWQVITNTPEREVTKVDGRRSWAFPPSPVFSTYIFALHAGPYKSWKSDANGIPLRLFARQSMAQYVDFSEWFQVTQQGFEFFQERFAYPYPYSKYDQVIVPDFNSGAMENVGAVTFNERFIYRSKVTNDRKRDRADVILHEMAHMWFGNLVTMRWWNGLWLNESFATLMAAWATDRVTSYKGVWQSFFASEKQWGYVEDQQVTTHPIEVSVTDTDTAFTNFDGITYGKGASVLKQLMFYLGEDDFTEGVRRYFQRYAMRNTALADFIMSLAEASGQNLTDWTKQWLQIPGVNTVRADFKCAPDAKTGKSEISELVLRQFPSEFNSQLRSHKTRVALYKQGASGLEIKDILDVHYSGPSTVVKEAKGKACPAFVFPNHEDYDYVKIELDPASLRSVQATLGTLRDSLLRQMLWHTLWEMVTDGKLPAQEYANIAITQARKEKDTQVLAKILRNLISSNSVSSTALKFMAPSLRAEYETKLEKFARSGMDSAPPGSDLQLIWFGAYLGAARSQESASFLERLLKGKTKLSGLKMEQERRWETIQTLSRLGAAGAHDLIRAELKTDSTDAGFKEAIRAEAMLPDPKVKSAWYSLVSRKDPGSSFDSISAWKGDRPLKNAELLQAIRAFHVTGQEELSRPFVSEFYESLLDLQKTEDESYLRAYSGGMFPPFCDSEVADRAGSLARKSGMSSITVKNLRVSKQWTERCARARAVSASAAKDKPATP